MTPLTRFAILVAVAAYHRQLDTRRTAGGLLPAVRPGPGDGWRPLFDGKTTAGWRGFRQKTMPAGWQAVDGALTRVGQAGDIVTVDEFGDFELTVDWNLSPNGNSGIHYRVTEDDEVMWHQAPEYQVIDNAYKDPSASRRSTPPRTTICIRRRAT